MDIINRLTKLKFLHELRWCWVKAIASEQWRRRAERYRWIFILGCNNSGTTLLVHLFAKHPEICAIAGRNVTKVLPHPLSAGVARIWTERLDLFRFTEADHQLDFLRLLYDWVSTLPCPSRPFVLEKAPPDMVCSRWLQKVFPNASFVGLVRNGYAVTEGIRRREGYSLDRCARHWHTTNKILMADCAYLKRFLLVHYEDLAASPRETVGQICQFLGIDSLPLEPAITAEWDIHNMDNTPSKIQDFNAKSLALLSERDIEIINLHAREMLERFGYFSLGARS
jgi:hypothetical protein